MIIDYDHLKDYEPLKGDRIISKKGYLVGVLKQEGEMEDEGKWEIDWIIGERKIPALLTLDEVLSRGYRIASEDEEVIIKEETNKVASENSENEERKTEITENDEEVIIDKLIKRDGFITNKSWREERRIFDSLKSGQELKRLIKKGLLRSEGERKGMKYYKVDDESC